MMDTKNKAKDVSIEDPILNGINSFIETITSTIMEQGAAKLKMFEGLYKQFKTEGPLDTVEENLKGIENKRHL